MLLTILVEGVLPQSKLLDYQVTSNPNLVQTNNNIVVNSEVILTPQQIEEVWNKSEIIDNYNPQLVIISKRLCRCTNV